MREPSKRGPGNRTGSTFFICMNEPKQLMLPKELRRNIYCNMAKNDKQWSSATPGLLIILLDQSGSMMSDYEEGVSK